MSLKLFIISLFFTLTLSAQTFESVIDSISQKSPTEQVRILNSFCWKLRSNNPDEALKFGEKAVSIAEKIKDAHLLATAHNFLGVIYRNISEYGTAVMHYKKALKISTDAKDSLQIAYAYNNLGGIHRMQLQFTIALENIMKALNIFMKLGNKRGEAFCKINIGIIYRELKNDKLALKYLTETAEIRKELGDKFGEALAYHHISELYFKKKEYKKSLEYNSLLEKSYKTLNEKKGIAYLYNSYASIYYELGDLEKAKYYREKSLPLHRAIKSKEGEFLSLLGLGLIYAKEGDYIKGKKYIDDAEALLAKHTIGRGRLELKKTFAEYYHITGQLALAWESMKEYQNIQDSTLQAENLERIAALEDMHSTETTMLENEMLKKDMTLQEKQKEYLFILVVVSLVFVVLLVVKILKTRELNKKLLKTNIAKDKFFGILAHDLKNPFNSLLGYSELLIQSYDEFSREEKLESLATINDASKRLYQLVQNLLEWFRVQSGNTKIEKHSISVAKEISGVIELLRPQAENKNIAIVSEVSEDLEITSDPNILSAILRNLINNAIKFTHNGGSIIISVKSSDLYVNFEVIDDGVGMDENTLSRLFKIDENTSRRGTADEHGSGLGLLLVKELAEQLSGEISVSSQVGKGSTFRFSIPRG